MVQALQAAAQIKSIVTGRIPPDCSVFHGIGKSGLFDWWKQFTDFRSLLSRLRVKADPSEM
jgi:hypothetical protein